MSQNENSNNRNVIETAEISNKDAHVNLFTQGVIQTEADDLLKGNQMNQKPNEQQVTQNVVDHEANEKKNPKEQEQVKIQDFTMEKETFNMGIPAFFRIFFVNTTKLMYYVSKHVISKKKKMDLKHIPELEEDEKVDNQYWKMGEALDRISKGERITGKHVYSMVNYIFRKEFISSHIVIALSLVVKSFNSIIIQRIITSYKDDQKNEALFWAFMLFILLIINVTLNNNSFNMVQNMSTQIRLNLVTFLYTKASNLTNYQIQKANIGKLFNLISYDMSTLEMMIYFGFMIVYIPLLLVVSGVILYFRFGGYGLLSILIIFLIVPLQLVFGLRQKKYMDLKNKYSDERIKLVNESVEGIRLMKMYGWEEAFGKYVKDVRKKELGSILNIQLFRATDRGVSTAFVLIATFIPILIIQYTGAQELNSSKIYATLEQLYSLKSTLFLTGVGIGFMFQVGLILNRFADFLRLKKQHTSTLNDNQEHNTELFTKQLEIKKKKDQLNIKKMVYLKENPGSQRDQKAMKQFELTSEESATLAINNPKYIEKQYAITEPMNDENAAEFVNFSSFWDVNNPPVLKNIKLNLKKGKQYGIVGKVGSGKSTFLQVMLEEIPHLKGEFRKKGSVSYVEQEPYIFSGKFKDNILFGKPYEEEFYNKVIKACCLIQDLEQLPNGDETEIGERGVNLSGGQKARLSLARAVYSRSDIYLLDDPLSAVDSKVAKKLYRNCLNGLLKDSTVLLVTHQIHYTKTCHEIIVLDDGKIASIGNFDELETVLLQMANQETFGDDKSSQSRLSSVDNEAVQEGEEEQQDLSKQKDMEKLEDEKLQKIKEKKGKLFIQEKEEKFDLSMETYKRYFGYIKSNFRIIFVLALYLASEGLYSSFYYIFGSYDERDDKDQLFYVSGILMLGFIIVCITKYLLTVLSANIANQNIHHDMFNSITRTPVLYFDQTPSGRILNKFSSDLGSADMMLPFMLFDSIEGPLQLLNICITVGVFNPWYFILATVMILSTVKLIIINKPMIVESKQLDLIFKSPVYSFFAKTIQGIIHIRIYKQVDNFLKQMFKNANNSIRTNYTVWRFNRGFAFNQQTVTAVFSAMGTILAIYTSGDSDKIGQTIVYLTMLIEVIAALSRQIPNLDSNMTSVERVLQICSLPAEDPLVLPTDHMLYENKNIKQTNINKSHSWVKNGDLVFQNVQMKYRKDLDLVLKGTNFKINGGERVGCVGRTGAGKSSILQALFRMCPIEQGSLITIDGVDIKQMGLHTLRNAISIIPQIPFVFSGSIRRNLDPLEEYSDAEIWQALKQTDLEETVRKLPNNILTDMSNAQSVFSTGQKQLICLARAILKNSKILVLDEATANVDMRTDEFIQNAIKEQFSNSTIFTIAHRLNTIADYDKVIVMDKGIVSECDSPFKLLAKNISDESITSDSIFASMVQNTGKDNAQNIFNLAKSRYLKSNALDE